MQGLGTELYEIANSLVDSVDSEEYIVSENSFGEEFREVFFNFEDRADCLKKWSNLIESHKVVAHYGEVKGVPLTISWRLRPKVRNMGGQNTVYARFLISKQLQKRGVEHDEYGREALSV